MIAPLHALSIRRLVAAAPLLALLAHAPRGSCQTDESIYRQFDEISALRGSGEFDRAIDLLKTIVRDYSDSEDVLRRAYNDLTFTILLKRGTGHLDEAAKAAILEEATAHARGGLTHFPDLTADRHFYPPEVNEMYDALRAAMFGAVQISTDPPGCRVFLDGAYVGTSPVRVEYQRVGEFTLAVSHSGYTDETDLLRVIAGGMVEKEITLSRERDRKWWLTRIVPLAAATGAGILAASLSGGDDDGGESLEPLPEPPPPPGR